MIAADIYPKPSGNLSNITFTLTHGNVVFDKTHCAFINESTNGFSKVNCSVVSSDETRTECTCNHMTSFAVITKIKENEVCVIELPSAFFFNLAPCSFLHARAKS